MDLLVPESIYGMAVAEPSALSLKCDGKIIVFGELFHCYTMLALNYGVQTYFLYSIALVDFAISQQGADANDGWFAPEYYECMTHNLMLKVLCVFIFMVTVFEDMKESVNLTYLLWYAQPPKPDTFEPLKQTDVDEPVEGGAILAAARDETPRGDKKKRINAMFQKAQHPVGLKRWSMDGVSTNFRVLSFLVVVVPKTIICVALAYYGGLYVADQQTLEDMFLNTLAVNFIVQVDEILFAAFTPEASKDQLTHMKPVSLEITNKSRFRMWLFSSVMHPALTLGVTVFVVYRSLVMQDC